MKATVGKNTFEVAFQGQTITINGTAELLDILKTGTDRFHVIRNGKSFNVEVIARSGKGLSLRVNGKTCEVTLADRMDELLKQLGMEAKTAHVVESLRAPMPGLVVGVRVQPGQEVKKGDPLVVLEAMKMENVLKSHGDARVKSIRVQKGDAVEKGQVLMEFEG